MSGPLGHSVKQKQISGITGTDNKKVFLTKEERTRKTSEGNRMVLKKINSLIFLRRGAL
jgi:hypothetical protein